MGIAVVCERQVGSDRRSPDRRPSRTVVAQLPGRGPLRSPAVILDPIGVIGLQRSAGNAAVSRALTEPPAGGQVSVQRNNPTVSVGPVGLNHRRVSLPLPAGIALQARVPAGQSVTWSLEDDTAAVDSGSSIDAAGAITVGADQAGGRIWVKADDAGGSGASHQSQVALIKAPGSISGTAETGAAGSRDYGADFKHTFDADGGGPGSECEGGRVNEIFLGVPSPNATSHRMTTPFGAFTLSTNNPASTTAGWGIDGSGQMTGDDEVAMARRGVDIRPFVMNASNPTPAQSLPVSFTVDQSLRSFEIPTNTWRAPFVSVPHVRGLRETGGTAEFFVSSNGTEHADDYTGRPAVRNAQAYPTSVEASSTPPPGRRGRRAAGATSPNTVQISAETLPAGARLRFSIVGPRLGCSVNARTGLLTIGSTPGTIVVRVAEPQRVSHDEVTVTITPAAAPAPVP